MIDDQTFFAWLDGELSADEAARIAALVEQDPELARRAAEHRSLKTRLQSAFDPIVQEPVTLRTAQVVDMADARKARRPQSLIQQVAALAATLLVGIMLGGTLARGPSGPVVEREKDLVAAAGLSKALDVQLASAPADGSVRIGLTFRARDGRLCRTFGDQSYSGLACRGGDEWKIENLVGPAEGQSGQFRMAAGPDPRLAAAVDSIIEGEPFGPEQEREARDSGWR